MGLHLKVLKKDLMAYVANVPVKRLGKYFHIGQESSEDNANPGRLVKFITKDNVALVEELVLNRGEWTDKSMTKFSDTTVCRILHDQQEMHKVSARWVTRTQWWTPFSPKMVFCYDPLSKIKSMVQLKLLPRKCKIKKGWWLRSFGILILIAFKETITIVDATYYAVCHKLGECIREN